MIVFDLDGVLLDTREIVRRSYLLAGVHMPHDAWGRPWQEWCDEEVHDLKNELYVHEVRHARPLPAYWVAHDLGDQGVPVMMLTSASEAAVTALRAEWELPPLLQAECITGTKRSCLIAFNASVYVDDNAALGVCATAHTPAQLIVFKDQDEETLRREVMEAWTQSS